MTDKVIRKVAAIYDIHGNLPALNAVLEELEKVQPDLVVVGGDIVSGPMPGETLERLSLFGSRKMTESLGGTHRGTPFPASRLPPRSTSIPF